jgi:hypothetical protein
MKKGKFLFIKIDVRPVFPCSASFFKESFPYGMDFYDSCA